MRLERTMLASVVLAALLLVLKLYAWLRSGSIGLQAEVLNSGLDVLATGVVALGVYLASRPADPDHPYGHGKFENIAALVEAGLLVGLAAYLVRVGLVHVLDPRPLVVSPVVVGIVVVALIVDLERTVTLWRAARATRSPAARVDLAHFSMDAFQMLGVLAGLLLAARGFPRADGAAAVLVGVTTLVTAVIVGYQAAGGLTDRVTPELRSRVHAAVTAAPGVLSVGTVRVREAGRQTFVDAEIGVARALSSEATHGVTEAVEGAVRASFPGADVRVHAEPVAALEDVATTAKVVGARDPQVAGVHEIHVVETPEGTFVACHVEVQPGLSLAEAHAVAQRFEASVKEQSQGVRGVTTHIEVAEPARRGRDVTRQRPRLVAGIRQAARDAGCPDPHHVVITQSDGGLQHALVHLDMPGSMGLAEAHAKAERVERLALERLPDVGAVTIHLEPAA